MPPNSFLGVVLHVIGGLAAGRIQADVPRQNVVALFDAAHESGGYGPDRKGDEG